MVEGPPHRGHWAPASEQTGSSRRGMVVEASVVPHVDKVAVCLLLECLIRSALVSKTFAIPLCPGPSTAGGDLWDSVTELKVCDWGFTGSASGKGSACQCRRRKRHGFAPWVGKIPWRRKWPPTLVFWLGKFHGQRSLVGYSPWGLKKSDTTEQSRSSIPHGIKLFCISPFLLLNEGGI